jgi:transcriptional regulator with GAF, ATPase, and Fis domain
MASADGATGLGVDERLRFEALVADLCSQFIDVEVKEIDRTIDRALAQFGEQFDVDIVAIAQLAADRPTMIFTHSWARDPRPSLTGEVDAGRIFPFGLGKLLSGEVHAFSTLDELPAGVADREFARQSGIKSAVAAPLSSSGQVFGAFAFGCLRNERHWNPHILARVGLVADLFTNVLSRKRADDALRRVQDDHLRFETLVADLALQFVSIESDRLDDAISDGLCRLAEAVRVDRTSFFEFNAAGLPVLAHSWARQGYDAPPLAPPEIAEYFPWLLANLKNGETICIDRLDQFPPDSRDAASMERLGMVGVAVIPLRMAGRIVGALTFGALQPPPVWPPENLDRLALVGHVFATALTRKRAEDELRAALDENMRLRDRLVRENVYLRQEATAREGTSNITGQSAAIRTLLAEIDQVAGTAATVLLQGETGSGKELVARAIHERSPRAARAMVRVNCAAIPATLMESELFGHEKGAYTGAIARQIGKFEVADDSTIFLDEIGELSPELQVKLLRVLQEREIERLGGSRPIAIDVRVIAATNRDLEQMVADETFREDLFYRLNVFPIRVPPLRERPEDIPALVWLFVDEFSKTLGKRVESIPKDHMAALQRYPWPGNVRELRNAVERAMIVSSGLRLAIHPPAAKAGPARKSLRIEDVSRDHIRRVLEQTRWRVRGEGGAAELLGLKPSTLESRMSKLGLRRPS